MTVARHYVMRAADGKAEALEQALRNLADTVRTIPGSLGVELLRDQADASRFFFIERWESVEAHKDGGKSLPKEAMAPVGAALAGAPEASWLDCLATA